MFAILKYAYICEQKFLLYENQQAKVRLYLVPFVSIERPSLMLCLIAAESLVSVGFAAAASSTTYYILNGYLPVQNMPH